MNKKFFTLMAVALLGGAAMPSEAFAQADGEGTHQSEKVDSVAITAGTKLANGLKFMLRTHNAPTGTAGNFYSVKDSAGYKIYADSAVAKAGNGAVFEIRNLRSDNTFELFVDGKQFVKGIGTELNTIFYGSNDAGVSALNTVDFNELWMFKGVGATDTIFKGQGTGDKHSWAVPFTRRFVETAKYLNAHLNGSLKFGFPQAKTEPAENILASDLIAIDWKATGSTLVVGAGTSGSAVDSVVFVLNNDEGKAYKDAPASPEKMKAATFVVVSPVDRYGLTQFNQNEGEGFKLMTIKGEALAAANEKKTDGTLKTVSVWNAAFEVVEEDMLNAEGELTLAVKPHVYKADGTSAQVNNAVYVGAYTPTEAGAAYYVTTMKNTREYVYAQIGGSSYADTKALLKTDAPAIYNIYFCGSKPSSGSNYYGKYYAAYANKEEAGKVDTMAVAPNKAALTSADLQWIVTDAGESGYLELTSARDLSLSIQMTLYKTDTEGVYDVKNYGGKSPFPVGGHDGSSIQAGADKIQLIAATKDETYRTLTDTELKQTAELVFKGESTFTSSEIYVTHNGQKGKNPDASEYIATKDADESIRFAVEKASKGVKPYEYAYLKDGAVKTDGKGKVEFQSYYLKDGGVGLTFEGTCESYRLDTAYVKSGDAYSKNNTWHHFVFRKNYNGTTSVLMYKPNGANDKVEAAEDGSLAFFTDSLVNSHKSQALYITSAGKVDSTVVDYREYSDVAINFQTLGESLEAEPVYATFESEEGGISLKQNKNGIIEGIIANEAMTFKLDTADSDALLPTFYVRTLVADAEEEEPVTKAATLETMPLMLFSPKDSANYWNAGAASWKKDERYQMDFSTDLKAVFIPALVTGEDTVTALVDGELVEVASKAKGNVVAGVENFKFHITKAGETGYYITNADGNYLYNLNGKLGFTSSASKALVVTLGEGDATANEAIEAAGVQVIGGQGAVTVQGAAGKVITVANILGQTIANQVAASDNVTIAAPAGIVVVAVEGEATKVVVK